jgi:hypothetical protein
MITRMFKLIAVIGFIARVCAADTRVIKQTQPPIEGLIGTNLIALCARTADLNLRLWPKAGEQPIETWEVLLSDRDIVDWDLKQHIITITPQGAFRLGSKTQWKTAPFSLLVKGVQPFSGYYQFDGTFWTDLSSMVGPNLPTIYADTLIFDALSDNVPEDALELMRFSDEKLFGRLMELTNRARNVRLELKSGETWGRDYWRDWRDDPKLTLAVNELLARKRKENIPPMNRTEIVALATLLGTLAILIYVRKNRTKSSRTSTPDASS